MTQRWNGWGDTSVDYPLPENGLAFLIDRIGPLTPPRDATLPQLLASVPAPRPPLHRAVHTDAETRLRHARGQSFPDWLALRTGRVGAFPDGVAFPETEQHVADLLQWARSTGTRLVPYGGGTSVVGHINPPRHVPWPVVTVNLQRLNRMLALDKTSALATFGAGVAGPTLEAHLRANGFTLGHFPQSFEYSTLGGWIATRSSGQQSRGYGRIEDLFAGGKVLSPAGTMQLPPFPASAAGPDLREMILGSEGRYGIITEATVRITQLPEKEAFHAVFFPDFARGQTAVRQMVQAQLPLSMVRLSTATETETTLKLAGHERLIGTLERLLALRGIDEGKSMLLIGLTGRREIANAARKEALQIASDHDGVHLGRQFGNQWEKSRFLTPYLRNTLWDAGVGVDTLETAVLWHQVDDTLAAIEDAIRTAAAAFDEQVHVFSHLSHVYPTGCSMYTTIAFRLSADADQTFALWSAFKRAASEAIVAHGGTISHQHGVGKDHAPYLSAEKGKVGMDAIHALAAQLDPHALMNPGTLLREAVYG